MKRMTLLIAVGCLVATAATAQPPGPPPDERGGPWERGRMAPPGHEPAAPIHRIMDDLRDADPERFERLQELRMTDPQAFRQETRALIHEIALKKLEEERPEVFNALSGLAEEDRDWLLDAMAKSRIVDRRTEDWKKERKGEGRGDRRQVRELVGRYRDAETDSEKDAIRAELRGYISAQYDQRIEMRAEQVRDMEEGVMKLRLALEQAEQDKDRFVDEKVDQILNGDWGKGRKRRGPPSPETE